MKESLVEWWTAIILACFSGIFAAGNAWPLCITVGILSLGMFTMAAAFLICESAERTESAKASEEKPE